MRLQKVTKGYRRLLGGAILTLGVVLPVLVFAESHERDIPLQISILSKDTVRNIAEYIEVVYRYAVGIAGLMAVVMIMYGGMKWIFAAGDKGKISAAKEVITLAVIGLVLALGSFVILNTINPRLVKLQVPNVFPIERQQLVFSWCPNEGEHEGSYPCGQSVVLRGEGGFVGQCIGAHCDTGGCFSVNVEGKAGQRVYACVDPAVSPPSCDAINGLPSVRSDNDLRVHCTSPVFKDSIAFGCRVFERYSTFNVRHPTTKCVDRLRIGDKGCEFNEECAYGLMCNFGEAPNACRPANSLPAGTACDKDEHCESGICNFGYANDQCAPVGGMKEGEGPCDRNQECASGLICRETIFGDTCIRPRTIPNGERCRLNEVCASGRCGEGESLISIDGRCE